MASMRQQALLGTFLAVALVAWSAAAALAKEGIIARLDAPLPSRAAAGAMITMGWTVTVPGGGSLVGTATVLRVFSRDGHASLDALPHEDRSGHFVATFRMPAGGIATVGIGIPGTSCGPSGCQPAVAWFTVEDPSGAPLPSVPLIAPPDTATSDPFIGKGSMPAPVLPVAGLAGLAVVFVVLGLARWMRRA